MRVSSYFSPMEVSANEVQKLSSGIYKGQIQKVIYPDEKESVSKIYVEYEVLVELSTGVSTFSNVPSVSAFGGYNDYEDFVYEPSETALSGKNDSTNTFENRNGSIVAVAFLNNNFQRPIIIGAINHPKNPRIKSSDGISYIRLFRGVKTEINKDGEWSVTYQSPYNPDGKLKSESTGPSYLKLDKTGSFEMVLKKDAIKQKHDASAEKTSLEYKSGLKITFDGKGDKVTIKNKSNVEATFDGNSNKVSIKSGSTEINIEGTSNKVSIKAGSTEIDIDGGSGKISIKANLVDVGDAASALAVLGPQLISWLASHTHMGDGNSAIPAPTSPPLTPPPSTLLSNSVKLKE
jgi:hypothetical protein